METVQKVEEVEQPKMLKAVLNTEVLQRLQDDKFTGGLRVRWSKGVITDFSFGTSYHNFEHFRRFRMMDDGLEEDE